MDKIKSAWEIALEKTKEVKADRESLKEHEYTEKGKMIVSQFFDNPEKVDLKDALNSVEKKYQPHLKKGMLEALLSNLTLPLTDYANQRSSRVKAAFCALSKEAKQANNIFSELEKFFSRYQKDREKIQEQIKTQYMPRLKQKAAALAQQLGAQVELDPFADPEFNALLKKTLNQLDEGYNQILKQAKEELKTIF
jgi:hypothetical protein